MKGYFGTLLSLQGEMLGLGPVRSNGVSLGTHMDISVQEIPRVSVHCQCSFLLVWRVQQLLVTADARIWCLLSSSSAWRCDLQCCKEVSALQKAHGKAEFTVIPFFQKHGFSGLAALDLGKGSGGRKEVMQNTCSAASATDEGGFDFGCRVAESELSCQYVAYEKCWIGALTQSQVLLRYDHACRY